MTECLKYKTGSKGKDKDYITREGVFRYMWMNTELSDNHKEYIYEKYPNIWELQCCIREFRNIFKNHNVPMLYLFVEKYSKNLLKPLRSFAEGLKRDIDAVENAVAYDYSNGFVEGTNSRLKMIKRTMYGIIDDCGFTTAKEMIRENCKAHLPKFIPSSIFEFFLEAGTRIWGDFDLEQADACKALSQTDIPVLIIHGNEDTKAPLSMAYKLYDSCRSEKEIYIVNGADHAENYQADPEKYGDIIIRFIKKHMSYSQKED